MLKSYLTGLYQRAMQEAYGTAYREIVASLDGGGRVLDCGAGDGWIFDLLKRRASLPSSRYTGIEWDPGSVSRAQQRGLDVSQGDLNNGLPFENEEFACVFALSVLEHLLNGCRFMSDCHRVLEKGGKLILLTPNISTYFTAVLILAGKMPSSGPHPDSSALVKHEELFRVISEDRQHDVESNTPMHRHIVVFSYRVLRDYLQMIGFSNVKGFGFGLYPFPNLMQPMLQRLDPFHCHQMVFVATR